MIIAANGRFDWAMWQPGPPANRYPWNNSMKRIYHHSLEGYYATTRPPVWHWTVLYDGTLVQHFSVFAGLPHGGAGANPYGPGGETEGIAGELLNPAQVATWLRIHQDMRDLTGIDYQRTGANLDGCLVEHGEAAQTACPSGRYAPLWAAIAGSTETEEEDMADPRVDELIAAFGGIEAIRAWNGLGNSLLAGYGQEQAEQDSLEGRLVALELLRTEDDLPSHTHTDGQSGPVKR